MKHSYVYRLDNSKLIRKIESVTQQTSLLTLIVKERYLLGHAWQTINLSKQRLRNLALNLGMESSPVYPQSILILNSRTAFVIENNKLACITFKSKHEMRFQTTNTFMMKTEAHENFYAIYIAKIVKTYSRQQQKV